MSTFGNLWNAVFHNTASSTNTAAITYVPTTSNTYTVGAGGTGGWLVGNPVVSSGTVAVAQGGSGGSGDYPRHQWSQNHAQLQAQQAAAKHAQLTAFQHAMPMATQYAPSSLQQANMQAALQIQQIQAQQIYQAQLNQAQQWAVASNPPSPTPPIPSPQPPADNAFNRFVVASDLLEEFSRFARDLGVRKRQFMELPLELFIQWVIIRAAEAEGAERPAGVQDPKVVLLALPKPADPYGSRCLDCKRFIPEARAAAGIKFCSGSHMDRYLLKAA